MNTTKRVAVSAMFAALCCVATMMIKIPSPLNGYLNLGDCVVLLSGWLLPPAYGFLAAGIGSALADVFSGYVVYAPATFVIKGLMALVAFKGFAEFSRLRNQTAGRVISGALAEVLMIVGYYVFEGFLYGWLPSAVNILPNAVQGAVGLVLGIALARLFVKNRIVE
ncbi:MAG: ECF transporter S component [bacterium]|nr:ECF transporter S component [Clostridia bacterium]MDD6142146.1 ECF transporter S component [bacterium]